MGQPAPPPASEPAPVGAAPPPPPAASMPPEPPATRGVDLDAKSGGGGGNFGGVGSSCAKRSGAAAGGLGHRARLLRHGPEHGRKRQAPRLRIGPRAAPRARPGAGHGAQAAQGAGHRAAVGDPHPLPQRDALRGGGGPEEPFHDEGDQQAHAGRVPGAGARAARGVEDLQGPRLHLHPRLQHELRLCALPHGADRLRLEVRRRTVRLQLAVGRRARELHLRPRKLGPVRALPQAVRRAGDQADGCEVGQRHRAQHGEPADAAGA